GIDLSDWGIFPANLFPVALEFFGQQLRKGSGGSLAIFRLVNDEVDNVVLADLDEGVELRGHRCRSRLRGEFAFSGKIEADQQAAGGRSADLEKPAAIQGFDGAHRVPPWAARWIASRIA